MYRILLLHKMPDFQCRVKDYLQLGSCEVEEKPLTAYKEDDEIRCYDSIIVESDELETCLRVCKDIRKRVQTPIIVLSENEGEWEKIKLFSAGIDDYIVKPYMQGELLARLQGHIERYKSLTRPFGVIKVEDLEINSFSRRVYLNGIEVDLRLKEFEVLLYLAQHMNIVLTKEQIYQTVWKDNLADTFYNTVAVHVMKIRGKIEKDVDNPRYIETVWGVGYRFRA